MHGANQDSRLRMALALWLDAIVDDEAVRYVAVFGGYLSDDLTFSV